MHRRAAATLFLFALAALAGCGQTGPLYMPGEEPPGAAPPAEQPAATPAGETSGAQE